MDDRQQNDTIVHILTSYIEHYPKRQTQACLSLCYLFDEFLNKSLRKLGKKSRIHNKHKAIHFRVQTPNGRRQKGNFCRLREKQTSCLISLIFETTVEVNYTRTQKKLHV